MSQQSRSIPTGHNPGRLVRRQFLAGLALLGAGVVAACASSSAATSSTDANNATVVARVSNGMNGLASAAQSANITLVKATSQKTFDPPTVAITVGSTVSWMNDATTPQSATFNPTYATTDGDIALPTGVTAFDSGMIGPGQSWTHTFTAPGTYKYACVPNEAAGMKGTVVVS